ncbi:hypothetical protein SmJEL517_g02743 [Synchytrium microbalum]|uniref:ABC transporter domain-containing protein n=1 Tax=Synchytrium microbalum TaxID=1806994 RepID=A0A507C5E1_9FUNG|nr:uncharacterized protein SmJEL517_g02743 [Synchytrium microbalum]TPX34701.1 hypothetical protein SmJEL517_g02743 [Synchytrium microbalum]
MEKPHLAKITRPMMSFFGQLTVMMGLRLLLIRKDSRYLLAGALFPALMTLIATGLSRGIQNTIPSTAVVSAIPIVASDFSQGSASSLLGIVADSSSLSKLNIITSPVTSYLMALGAPSNLTVVSFDSISAYASNVTSGYKSSTSGTVSPGGFYLDGDATSVIYSQSASSSILPILVSASSIAAQAAANDTSPLYTRAALSTLPASTKASDVSAGILPSFIVYGLSFTMPFVAGVLVDEIEMGMQQQLTTAGLPLSIYFVSAFLVDGLVYVFGVFVILIVIRAFALPAFMATSFLAWFLPMLCAGPALIWLAYIVSFFFKKSATVAPFLSISMAIFIFIPYFIVYFFENNIIDPSTVFGLTIVIPTFGLYRAIDEIAGTAKSNPYTISDCFNASRLVLPVCLILLLDALIYAGIVALLSHLRATGQTLRQFLFLAAKPKVQHGDMEDYKADQLESDVAAERSRLLQGQDVASDAIRVLGLCKEFPSTTVDEVSGRKVATILKNLYMSVRRGETFAYLGINGAGKSTTIKILTNLLPPTSGMATVGPYTAIPFDKRIPAIIGVTQQQDILWKNLTGREHFMLYSRLKGLSTQEARLDVETTIQNVGLSEPDKRSKQLSGGNKRKISVGCALVGRPEILFLDEPTTGMDVEVRQTIWATINDLKERGATIVITTHSMEEADALASRIGILANGHLAALGTPQHLKNLYGQGYKITVQTTSPESAKALPQAMSPKLNLKVAQIIGKTVQFEMPLASDTASPEALSQLSEVFEAFEDAKLGFGVTDYSIAQNTLAHVFMSLVNQTRKK